MPSRPRGQPDHQVVDPLVSKKKFEREVAHIRSHEADYRRRGCLLVSADFPLVELLLGVPHVRPSALLFGLSIDLTNYDADPPSVRVVDPWTRTVLRAAELSWNLPVLRNNGVGVEVRPLLQAWNPPHDVPFMCARGVREYHRNPGHSGDSWWLHRKRGEGTLAAIVALLCKHGPDMIADYRIAAQFQKSGDQLQVQCRLDGFMGRAEFG